VSNLDRLRDEQKQLIAMLRGLRPAAQTSRIQARLGDILKQIREIETCGGAMIEPTSRPRPPELPGEFKPVRRSVKLRDEPTPIAYERVDCPYEPPAGESETVSGSRTGWLIVVALGIGLAILFICFLGMLRCEAATGGRACSNNSFLMGLWLADPH
jgi:hypothetical protein